MRGKVFFRGKPPDRAGAVSRKIRRVIKDIYENDLYNKIYFLPATYPHIQYYTNLWIKKKNRPANFFYLTSGQIFNFGGVGDF